MFFCSLDFCSLDSFTPYYLWQFDINTYGGVSIRKKHSLEKIHSICREQEQYERVSKDFSVATIAKISTEHDGPSEQTIRNKASSDYRALLKAWADYSEGYYTRQKSNQQSTTADTILSGISDPTTTLTIDMRA